MEKLLVFTGSGLLISCIWFIKAKTSYIYYYFAFHPEKDTPQKVAWISTLAISITALAKIIS